MSKTFFHISKVKFVYLANVNGLYATVDGENIEDVVHPSYYHDFNEEVIEPIIDDLCDLCDLCNSDGEYMGAERQIRRVVEKWADRINIAQC